MDTEKKAPLSFEGNDPMVTPAYGNGENGHEAAKSYDHYLPEDTTVGHMDQLNERGEIEGGVRRTLKQRHMAMIAIGGAIGTGLFIGTGGALASGGPVALWLAYCLMATMVFSMMVALGEMATLYPVSGAFTHYASRFCDPALGFAVGFNYWYSWAITIPVEVVAAAIIIEYWDTKTNPAAYITIFIFVIWAVNFMGARAYGETEFWASIIKVLTITGLIILSLVLMCGGGPDKDAIGFRYWRNPGPFNQMKAGDGFVGGRWGQFLAFWNVFVQAAFSFIGTEIIGTTLGEAENPRRTVPRAIKRVFWRLVIFYVLGTFFISVLVPYNDPTLMGGGDDASASPFVIAINRAGIKGLPSVVNAAILTSAISAGVSDLYASSRTLYALALQRQAPAIFRYCTKQGLPLWCVVATGLFGFLAYLNTGGATAIEAFNYLYALAAITGILAWWAILLSYLRFFYGLKKQGLTRDSHPYKAPFQPYLSWFGFISFNLILLFNGFPVFIKGNWETSTFITAYIGIIIFIGSFVFWKLLKRTKWVRLEDIDFMSGRRALDAMEAADAERFKPETTAQKISSWLF